jgi:hypothetical protein
VTEPADLLATAQALGHRIAGYPRAGVALTKLSLIASLESDFEAATEREAAAEQYQALTDRTIELAREEMPAYWRLFGWTEHQSLAELTQRADKTAVLNQFLQTPDEQRGKLFQFDLNVRRVLSYDAPANSAGIKKVYEVTGWTTESKAWLYVVLSAHLPAGMPTGPDVNERVTFAGYFLKVQGYHAAGAGPRDKALAAPLLIGRMTWNHPPIPATSAYGDGAWGYWPVAIMLLLGVAGLTIWQIVSRRAAKRRATTATSGHPSHVGGLHDWLASAQRGTMDEPTSNADFRFHDN